MKQLLLLYFFLISLFIFSQTKTEKMLGSWYMYHGNHYVSKNWLLQSGFQLRTYDVVENHNLTFGYVGIGFKTNSQFLFTFKYGYLEIDRSIEFNDEPNAIEHRIMEDVAYSFQIKKHKFSHRIRLEHRFIHFENSNLDQHRLRYRILYLYPVLKKITFDISNEFFFNNNGISYSENRFYVGFKIKTSKTITLNLGYMEQWINELHLNRLQFGVVITTGKK